MSEGRKVALSKLSPDFETIFLAFTVSCGSSGKQEKCIPSHGWGALVRGARQTTRVGDHIVREELHDETDRWHAV